MNVRDAIEQFILWRRRGEAGRVNGREDLEEGVGTRVGRSPAGFGRV